MLAFGQVDNGHEVSVRLDHGYLFFPVGERAHQEDLAHVLVVVLEDNGDFLDLQRLRLLLRERDRLAASWKFECRISVAGALLNETFLIEKETIVSHRNSARGEQESNYA
jgi:hypothetical protein